MAMTTTPKLGLKLPALDDPSLITDLNDNFVILDDAILAAVAATLSNKTLTAPILNNPVVNGWTNAQHTHLNAAGAGALDGAAITTGDGAGTGDLVRDTGASLTTLTLAGVTSLPRGSAAAPALSFDGGTGVYSQAEDRLGLATAGVVRVEVDAIGSLGLGMVPNALAGAAYTVLQLPSLTIAGNAPGGQLMLMHNSYFDGAWKAVVTGAAIRTIYQGGDFTLATAPSVTAGSAQTFSPRLTVDLAGRVGVGVTPAPSADILIQVGATGSLREGGLNGNSYYDGTNNRAIAVGPSTIFTNNAGQYYFYTAPSVAAGAIQAHVAQLVITNAGNVGVGVTPAPFAGGYNASQVGMALMYGTPGAVAGGIRMNSYFDGAGNKAIMTGAGTEVSLASGAFTVYTAPSVSAGAAQTMTARLSIDNVGLVALASTPTIGAAGNVKGLVAACIATISGALGNVSALNGEMYITASGTPSLVTGCVFSCTGTNTGTISNAASIFIYNPSITGGTITNEGPILHGNTPAKLTNAGAWAAASHEFKDDGTAFKLRLGLAKDTVTVVDTVKQMPIHKYTYAEGELLHDEGEHIGFFAEELYAIDPLLSDGKTVDPVSLVALAMSVIQDLLARVEALEGAKPLEGAKT